MPDFVPNEYLF